jgi:RNA polymerase sigma factor (sigma-70 family)
MTPRALFHPARLARTPVLSTQSDERLVDLVRAGSDPAFEAIVERYRRPLTRYASRLLAPERAEDVVQQAFVQAYEAMHRDSAELRLRPWLYRIAHNAALNALRDRALEHAELSDRFDGVERPDQALERTQGLRELVAAVQALPERQRNAILLRELEGRSYEEIATALGVTDGAVRQLLNRARNSLRAAAAAVVPVPLVDRLAASDSTEPVGARIAELVSAGSGALAIKLCATALVTSAVVGGSAVVPDGRDPAGARTHDGASAWHGASGAARDAAEGDARGGARSDAAGAERAGSGGREGSGGGRGSRDPGDDDGRDDRNGEDDGQDGGDGGDGGSGSSSGPGSGGSSGPGDSSGRGGGELARQSGSGTTGSGSSGPGSSGSGSSGSGDGLSGGGGALTESAGVDGGSGSGDSGSGSGAIREAEYSTGGGSGSSGSGG